MEETKEQIAQLDQMLNNYKLEKHELFNTLKKVLNTSKKLKETPAQPTHPTLYMQSAVRAAPGGGLYMKPNPQLLITSQPVQPQQTVKRPRSPSPPRSGIPAAYYRNPLHPGPSASKYVVTTAYSTPTTAHSSHYTSYPGSAVVSVGNHLTREQEEVARAAQKHIYLPQAGAPNSQRSTFSDRDRAAVASLHSRSLAPPPAAHSSVTAATVAAYNRPASIMSGFSRYGLPPAVITTSGNSVTLASAISSSPRQAHSQNGTAGPPPPQRYYPRES